MGHYILDLSQIGAGDVARVGGKNANLGELFNAMHGKGVGVLDGFATTSEAYRCLLSTNGLEDKLRTILTGFDPEDLNELTSRGAAARRVILETPLPNDLRADVLAGYERLCSRLGYRPELAVRSSATAEDLPEASFAGAAETFLNVRGGDDLLGAVHQCFASLFTDRAINYRSRLGYAHLRVALSVGVQPMVRSDQGSSGVIFTLEPESGFRDAVVVSGAYGLGESVVQGVVTPDEWMVFKPTLRTGKQAIINRRKGSKETRLVYGEGESATRLAATTLEERRRYCLTDNEVLELARWACLVEEHYSHLAGRPQPMDLEWAQDGLSGAFYLVQARPETVHSQKKPALVNEIFRLGPTKPVPLATGQAVGEKIATGKVRVVRESSGLAEVEPGDILVAEKTDPDWEPVMRRVAAIVTDHGGRTAHAAIVSRELGLPCLVGCGNATATLSDGQEVTVSCAEGVEGHVYPGRLDYQIDQVNISNLPPTHTAVMLNVGNPATAFQAAAVPNAGVGLARTEFIVSDIGIHPMALARYPQLKDQAVVARIAESIGDENPQEFFVRRLSEGIARIAAAFYPKPVIVRTSDFKTNEYARLEGGREFEPDEENPMLGFRGASRYYDERYAGGFALECAALRRVRAELGLTNVKIMIPFCRTISEAKKVIAELALNGLVQGEDGLEIYAMCELPANVVSAREFFEIFDGFSIGSNDLTQLVLGVDRDSVSVAHLFDELDGSVKAMIATVIRIARELGKPIGICGQAPSDFPDFARWLVEQGISSISLNPDSALKTTLVIAAAEREISLACAR